jgi:hypothetical protein
MKTTCNNLTTDNKEYKSKNTLSNDERTHKKISKFQQRLTNISKKLGLSYAVFQR